MKLAKLSVVASFLLILVFQQAAIAEELVFFDGNGGNGFPRGLFNFETGSGEVSFRVPIAGNERVPTLDVHPVDGRVFGVNTDGLLFTLDIVTGLRDFIGNTGVGIKSFAFDKSGIKSFGITIDGAFYDVDPANGTSTFIGQIEYPTNLLCDQSETVTKGLTAAPDGKLLVFGEEGNLFEISPNDASLTYVGRSDCLGLVTDSAVTDSGALYIIRYWGPIHRVDPTTGNSSFVGRTGTGTENTALIPTPQANFPSTRRSRAFVGLYFGSFQRGQFAVLVRKDGTAVFLLYDANDEEGFKNENIAIGADGSFTISPIEGEGIAMTGVIEGSSLQGHVTTVTGLRLPFTGGKVNDEGPFEDIAGYHNGPLSGLMEFRGRSEIFDASIPFYEASNYAILAPDGRGFILFDIWTETYGERSILVAEEGGFFQAQPNGEFEGVLLGGLRVSGTLNNNSQEFDGSVFQTGTEDGITLTITGDWTSTQRLPLPKVAPPLTWLPLLLD